jgi:heme-degrading monooxygenase HmoA
LSRPPREAQEQAECAATPPPPYFAVIFSSMRTPTTEGYAEATKRMLELAREQPGFLGVEAAREDGLGITVSYWASEEAIARWRRNLEHVQVQELGRERWYSQYTLRVARVEREIRYEAPPESPLPLASPPEPPPTA